MTRIEAEPFAPDYLRPTQPECPNCSCCTASLCERGRASVTECRGHTPTEYQDTVYRCPCSAATTRGTHAWRMEQIRVTRLAREAPLSPGLESLLRTIADGGGVGESAAALAQLKVSGLATDTDVGVVATQLGRIYLTARAEIRVDTPVEVVSVDTATRTAEVTVVAWSAQATVTVLLDPITSAVGIPPDELAGTWLEAEANCPKNPEDIVLTKIRLASPLPENLNEVSEGPEQARSESGDA